MARANKTNGSKRGKGYTRNGKRKDQRKGNKEFENKLPKENEGSTPDNGEVIKTGNDPSWYIPDEASARIVANLPFGEPLGAEIPVLDGNPASVTTLGAKTWRIPGVMRINFTPTMGVCGTASDPINVKMVQMYSETRRQNSGAKNYEPADQFMYIMAGDSLLMLYDYMMRAYGTIRTANPLNKYLPRALFQAQGLDFDSFLGRQADFKAYLDYFKSRLDGMVIPTMYITERHHYLCTNVWADEDNIKGQFMIPVPTGFYKYHPYIDRTGGKVVLERRPENMTLDQLITYAEGFINSMFHEFEVGTIAGDLLKAFPGLVGGVKHYDADYIVPTAIDPYFNLQLDNSRLSGIIDVCEYGQSEPITANESRYIVSNIHGMVQRPWNDDVLISVPASVPTPIEVVEATRGIFAGEADSTGTTFTNVGSEVFESIQFVNIDGNLGEGILNHIIIDVDPETGVTVENTQLTVLAHLSTFAHHPPINVVYPRYIDGELDSVEWIGRFGEISNFTTFDTNRLTSINRMTLMRLLTFIVAKS